MSTKKLLVSILVLVCGLSSVFGAVIYHENFDQIMAAGSWSFTQPVYGPAVPLGSKDALGVYEGFAWGYPSGLGSFPDGPQYGGYQNMYATGGQNVFINKNSLGTYKANTTYTLTAYVGQRNDVPVSDWRLSLTKGDLVTNGATYPSFVSLGTAVASKTNLTDTLVPGVWKLITVTKTIGASDTLIGTPIGIELYASYNNTTGGGLQQLVADGITLETTAIAVNQMDMLQYWAPLVYQDVKAGTEGFGYQLYSARDCIVGVNFDGNWSCANNWDNSRYQVSDQGKSPLYGKAYASCVESDDFYFLGYGFYHAGDDAWISNDRHQNDWEMIVVCIKKDGSDYGAFQGMMTQAHTGENLYIPSNINWYGSHPIIYIQPNGLLQGHGITAYAGDSPGSDGIVYWPAVTSENVTTCMLVSSNNWATAPQYDYKLIPMAELWSQRGKTGLYDLYYHYTLLNYERAENSPDGSYEGSGGNPPWDRVYFNDPVTYFRDNFPTLQADLTNEPYLFNPYYGNNSSNTGPFNSAAILSGSVWSLAQIGSQASGNVLASFDTYILTAKAINTSSTIDSYLFAYQSVSSLGDFEISGRIYSLQEINSATNVGLMMRNVSKNIYIYLGADKCIRVKARIVDSGSSSVIAQSGQIADDRPVWLKLRKAGNDFSAYYSYDGSSYTLLGSTTFTGTTMYAGMAIASEDSASYASACITNASIEPMRYALSVQTVGGGTVIVNPALNDYARGDVVSIEATPAYCSVFSGWSGDLVSSSNPASITITGSTSVIATFVAKTPNANLDASDSVNFSDMAILAKYWLVTNCNEDALQCENADFDCDSKVDFRDLTYFLEHWLN